MTNEEARAILEEVRTIDDSMYQYNPAYLEALEMAIAALKQPTDGIYITHNAYSDLCLHAAKAEDLERELAKLKPEPCEDCVSRKAMWKTVHECEAHNSPTWVWREMLAQLPSVTPKQRLCKDCKFFEYDHVENVDGIPLIVAHEICDKWGDGCSTKEDGYCFLFKPKMATKEGAE